MLLAGVLACLWLAVACGKVAASKVASKRVPHILFMLADDYGWNDIGYHANHSATGYYNSANPSGEQTTNAFAGMMRTPHLDQLASEGRKLESYYVQPLCSPTRSTIMCVHHAVHEHAPNPHDATLCRCFLPLILSVGLNVKLGHAVFMA